MNNKKTIITPFGVEVEYLSTTVVKNYPTGEKWVERCYWNVEDENEGDYFETWYYKNGNIMWKYEYEDGELVHRDKHDTDGRLVTSEGFKDGKLVLEYMRYNKYEDD